MFASLFYDPICDDPALVNFQFSYVGKLRDSKVFGNLRANLGSVTIHRLSSGKNQVEISNMFDRKAKGT
jgi:hypothetical protein